MHYLAASQPAEHLKKQTFFTFFGQDNKDRKYKNGTIFARFPAEQTSHFADLNVEVNRKQDAQLSQRDRAAGCVIVFAKSRTLELGANDLRTL